MFRVEWSEVKAFYGEHNKVVDLSCFDSGTRYIVWVDWHGSRFYCDIHKDGGDDQADFESNYASVCNQPRFDRTRITTCMAGRKAHYRYITFTTANQGAFNDDDETGVSLGGTGYIMHDINGDITTVNANAVRTTLVFHPDYDYEISGGKLCIPSALAGGDDNAWEAFVVGAPLIPKAYGGSIRFLNNNRLKWDKGGTIHMDEQMNPAEISGAVSAEARKIHITISHPAGAQSEFQIMFKLYKDPTE